MTTGLASGQANALLDALCRSVTYSDPACFYVKAHKGDPGSAGTANAATETTRQAVTFGAASGGVCTNSAPVAWTNVSTTETWTHVSYWSAVSGGTFLGSDELVTPRSLTAGDDPSFAVGQLTVSLAPLAA